MRKSDRRTESDLRRFALPMFVSVVLLVFFFVFFPNINLDTPARKLQKPSVNLLNTGNDGASVGFDEIYDYSPLFIPTRWNSAVSAYETDLPSGWDFDKTADVEYAKNLRTTKFLLDADADMARGRSSIARAFMRGAFIGYARTEPKDVRENKTDVVSFTLINLQTGEKLKSQSVESEVSKDMFSIAEFKVSVEKDGWVSIPLSTQSSGNEKADDVLAKMLTTSRLLKNVPHGDYKAIFVP